MFINEFQIFIYDAGVHGNARRFLSTWKYRRCAIKCATRWANEGNGYYVITKQEANRMRCCVCRTRSVLHFFCECVFAEKACNLFSSWFNTLSSTCWFREIILAQIGEEFGTRAHTLEPFFKLCVWYVITIKLLQVPLVCNLDNFQHEIIVQEKSQMICLIDTMKHRDWDEICTKVNWPGEHICERSLNKSFNIIFNF